MKGPRSRQRFPGGGKALYELLRMDHEPLFIGVWPEGRCPNPSAKDTLTFELEFDPMLYFWPVERQHVMVFLEREPHEDLMKRLSRAMLRDGADLVQFSWPVERTHEERALFARNWSTRAEVRTYGDIDAYMLRHYPEEQKDAAVAGSA